VGKLLGGKGKRKKAKKKSKWGKKVKSNSTGESRESVATFPFGGEQKKNKRLIRECRSQGGRHWGKRKRGGKQRTSTLSKKKKKQPKRH